MQTSNTKNIIASKFTAACGALCLLGAAASPAMADGGSLFSLSTVFSGTGSTSADLQSAVDAFRAAIGGVNNGANNALGTLLTSGRREINWDAGGLPANMPGNFFNANSRRGIEFTTPGLGFDVSLNTAGSEFGNINASYSSEFTVFSANRLFAARESTVTDSKFFLPNFPTTPAGVQAFGAVFTDVDLANVTGIELYGAGNELLASAFAPTKDKGLSFLGLILPNGATATSVRLISGNTPLGANNNDGAAFPLNNLGSIDVVAMDDFIFSEPVPVPEVSQFASAGLLGAGAALMIWRRRKAAQQVGSSE